MSGGSGCRAELPIKPSWPRLNHSNRSGSSVSVLAPPRGLKLGMSGESLQLVGNPKAVQEHNLPKKASGGIIEILFFNIHWEVHDFFAH